MTTTLQDQIAEVFREENLNKIIIANSPQRSGCRELLRTISLGFTQNEEKRMFESILRCSIIPRLRGAEYDTVRTEIDKWDQDLKRYLKDNPNVSHLWIRVIPEEICSPITQYQDCVPIQYWQVMWNDLFALVSNRLSLLHRAYFLDPNRIQAFLCTIFGETFYMEPGGNTYGLGASRDRIYPCSQIIPQSLNSPDPVDWATREHFRNQWSLNMEADAIYARYILMRKYFDETGWRTSRLAGPPKKNGDMFLIHVSGDQGPESYIWCKFGSQKKLTREYQNDSRLRAIPSLIPSLYDIITDPRDVRYSLEADFTSILVSRHEYSVSPEGEEGLPKTFEEECKDIIDHSAPLFSRVQAIMKLLGYLHMPPSSLTCWQNSYWTRYENLLATQKAIFEGDTVPFLVKSDGKYEIETIQPRDANQSVVFHLKHLPAAMNGSFKTILLMWRDHPDWRWKLWSFNITEGATVSLAPKVELDIQYERPQKHMGRYKDEIFKEKSFTKCVNRKQRKYIDPSGQVQSSSLLPVDLFPVFLHGDFHPRNVIVVPNPQDTTHLEDDSYSPKIIDLADAVVRPNDPQRVAMAFDFVTFEVDAKARMIYKMAQEKCQTSELNEWLDEWSTQIDRSEKKVWKMCLRYAPDCFQQSSWDHPPSDGAEDISVSEALFSIDWPIAEYKLIALWRYMALKRLWLGIFNATHEKEQDLQKARSIWTPARAYAQSLFLHSIGYLEYLDPAETDNWGPASTCIITAAHALDYM